MSMRVSGPVAEQLEAARRQRHTADNALAEQQLSWEQKQQQHRLELSRYALEPWPCLVLSLLSSHISNLHTTTTP